MNHPGLVNYGEVEDVLSQRECLSKNWPQVGVLDVCSGVANCIYLDTENLEKLLTIENSSNGKDKNPSLRIFLLQSHGTGLTANGHPASEVEAAAVNPVALRLLRERAGLSNLLIAATCGVGHWYSMKQAFFECQGNQERPKSCEVYYEYVFGSCACTQFITDSESTTYFCLNLPKSVMSRFTNDIKRDPDLASLPFYLDILIADEVMKQWQRDMQKQRSTLKQLEETDEFRNIDDTTRELHDLSKNWFIHFRNLSDFEAQLKFIHSASVRLFGIIAPQPINKQHPSEVREGLSKLKDTLDHLLSSCRSLEYLVTDYRGRTNTQINLLFHLANQAESRANKRIAAQNQEIAELTAELAQRTQRDSAAMITIAAVTMFFLPGTFVATIFGTVFFSFDDNGINISRKWWIVPGAAAPLTLLVFAIWLTWLRWRNSRDRQLRRRKLE